MMDINWKQEAKAFWKEDRVFRYAALTLVFLFALAAIGSIAKGELLWECQENNSFHNWTVGMDILNKTEPCQFGCDTNTALCNNQPSDVEAMPIIAGLTAIMLAFFIIAAIGAFNEKWWVLRFMFIMVGLYIGISDLEAIRTIAVTSAQVNLQSTIEAAMIIWNGAIYIFWIITIAVIMIEFWEYIVDMGKWFGRRNR